MNPWMGPNLAHFGANFTSFLQQKRPQWSQILCSDPEHDPRLLRVAFGGHLEPFLGNTRGEISSKMGPIWSHPSVHIGGPGGQGRSLAQLFGLIPTSMYPY